jgi:hypothetical protein
MIWVGCFEKHFNVIGGLLRLALRITLNSGDERLVGAVSILVVIALTAAGGDCDSLWSLLWLPLVTFSTLPCTLVGCLGWCPPTAAGGHLGTALHENSTDHFLARGMPGGDVEEFFCGLWLVMAELVYQGSAICAELEHKDDISNTDLMEFMTLLGEVPNVIL